MNAAAGVGTDCVYSVVQIGFAFFWGMCVSHFIIMLV